MPLNVICSCDSCGKPVCQRMYVVNLALGQDEETRCLDCLAEAYNQPKAELFITARHYVFNRECFSTAWHKLNDAVQCPLPDGCAFELCFSDGQSR